MVHAHPICNNKTNAEHLLVQANHETSDLWWRNLGLESIIGSALLIYHDEDEHLHYRAVPS